MPSECTCVTDELLDKISRTVYELVDFRAGVGIRIGGHKEACCNKDSRQGDMTGKVDDDDDDDEKDDMNVVG